MPTVPAVVPETDEELFRLYYPHIKYLVSRAHIRPQYVEDYAMVIMTKIIDKGLVKQYDPNHTSSANFKTFLSNFCNSYLYHFAERDRINADRHRISTNTMVGDSSTEGVPLLDYLGVWSEDDTDSVEVQELIATVFKHFEDNPKMTLFFELVLLQVQEHGVVVVKELAELFDVTRSSIHNWLKKLAVGFDQCR